MVREVVGEVWRMFLRRFWRTLLIVALLLAPLELAVGLLHVDLASDRWWLWVVTTGVVTLVAFPWVIGAVVHDAAEDDPTPTASYRQTAGHLLDLAISAAVTTVGILLATLAFVVPGLLLMARWALVVPLIVLEDLPWRRALGRSNDLVRGRTWGLAGIFVALTLIGGVLVAVPVLVGYLLVGGVIGAWIATLAIDTVGIAFYSFAPVVVYRRFTE